MSISVTLLASILTSTSVPAWDVSAEPSLITPQSICDVVGRDPADIRRAVVGTAGVRFHESIGEYDTFVDMSRRRLWTFTKPASPLPPTVVCRTVLERGSGSEVVMEIVCFGTAPQCDAMREEWGAFLAQQMNP